MSLTPRDGILLSTDDIFDFADDVSSVILKTRNQIIADNFVQQLKSHTAKAVSEKIRENTGNNENDTLSFDIDVDVATLFEDTIHSLGMTYASKMLKPSELDMDAPVLKNLGISIRKPYRNDVDYYLVYPAARNNMFFDNLSKMKNTFVWGYDGVSGEALYETKDGSREPIDALVKAASLSKNPSVEELTQQVVNDWKHASADAVYHMAISHFDTSAFSLKKKTYQDISEESKSFASNLSLSKWAALICLQDTLSPDENADGALDQIMRLVSDAMMFTGKTDPSKIENAIKFSNTSEALSQLSRIEDEAVMTRLNVSVNLSAWNTLLTEFQQYRR